MMTQSQADAIVESMFKWMYDEPLTSPERQAIQLSTIANVVCSASMPNTAPMADKADITCQPLHEAYQRAKLARGIK